MPRSGHSAPDLAIHYQNIETAELPLRRSSHCRTQSMSSKILPWIIGLRTDRKRKNCPHSGPLLLPTLRLRPFRTPQKPPNRPLDVQYHITRQGEIEGNRNNSPDGEDAP